MIRWKEGLRYQGKKKTVRARQLRKSMTDAERKIWRLLKDRRLAKVKFRRQVPFGPYILDFYSTQRKIAIELDGGQHFSLEGLEKDAKRDRFLSSYGIKVLRYTDGEALQNSEDIMQQIYEIIKEEESSPQSSPFQGEEDLLLNKGERAGSEGEAGMRIKEAMESASNQSTKGIVLIVAILALLVAAIFLPALIFVVSNETKWSVKQKKLLSLFKWQRLGWTTVSGNCRNPIGSSPFSPPAG